MTRRSLLRNQTAQDSTLRWDWLVTGMSKDLATWLIELSGGLCARLNYFINFHNTSVSHRITMLKETYLRESVFFSNIDTAASRTWPLWIVSIFSLGICQVEEGWLRGKKARIQCLISQGLTEYILLFISALSSLDGQQTLLGRDKQLSLGYSGTSYVVIRAKFISPPGRHTPSLTTWWGEMAVLEENRK